MANWRWVLAAILAFGLVALVIVAGRAARRGPPPAAPPPVVPAAEQAPAKPASTPMRFTRSAECRACHSAIYDEWLADEHANAWTEDVFRAFTFNYTKDECLSCHAPQPMLETGLDSNEPVLRAAFREDGVDCMSCHVRDGRTHGTLGTQSVCGGTLEPRLKTSQACYHCHATHNLFQEFLASPQYQQGMSCQDCHMQAVTRPVADGGKPRATRRHRMHAGGHDPEGLRKALEVTLAVKNGELVVTVTNVGAAHGVPGEINNRIVRLEVSVTELQTQRAPEGGEEQVWNEVQAHEAIFRAPPRLSRNLVPSTQILPGEPRVLRYPLFKAHGRATATLTYKLQDSMLDLDATPMGQWKLDF